MKAASVRIPALMSSLGFQKAEVVGHDIGLMVAYAYAALYPAETKKLVLMDVSRVCRAPACPKHFFSLREWR